MSSIKVIKVVTLEIPSLWGQGAHTPLQASENVLGQVREHFLHDGFWTIGILPPGRDTPPDHLFVTLAGADRPRESGRAVTVAVNVDAQGVEEAIAKAYYQLHERARGPWDFVVKYSGQSHAVAIAVTAGAPELELVRADRALVAA